MISFFRVLFLSLFWKTFLFIVYLKTHRRALFKKKIRRRIPWKPPYKTLKCNSMPSRVPDFPCKILNGTCCKLVLVFCKYITLFSVWFQSFFLGSIVGFVLFCIRDWWLMNDDPVTALLANFANGRCLPDARCQGFRECRWITCLDVYVCTCVESVHTV